MKLNLNIPRGQKTKDWGEQVMRHFVSRGVLTPTIKSEMEVLYKIAGGNLDEKDYSYVINPLGEEQRKRPELQGDPARIRNFDIIGPVINAYIGDFIARGTKFQAINPNYDIEEERAKEEQRLMLENLKAQFRQEMEAATGVSTELDNQQTSPEEIKQKLEQLPNTDAIDGQKALDYIRYFNETDRKYRLAYFDYITIGRFFTYRDAFKEETYFDVINPLDFNYVASQDCIFVEDAEAAWVDYKYTTSEIIDAVGEIMPKEALDWIESSMGDSSESSTGIAFSSNEIINNGYNELISNLAGRVSPFATGYVLRHMAWKARKKLGKLYQYGVTGESDGYIEVDEDFKPREGETVSWYEVNETWEGYSLDDKYFFGIEVLPLQRGSLGIDVAKLPFNGRTYGNRTSVPSTPVKKGKQFQELHNIVKYRLERILAKNKDKLIPLPIGAINDSKMDMFQTMYYADYHSYLFYDETNKLATQALSSVRPIDASLSQYIKSMYDISYAIRQEFYETIGFPRQKLADIKASDDVGNTQEAINRSNLLSEDIIVSFEEVQEKDYQALINLSKYVWVDGKKASFKNSDNEIDSLNLEPNKYSFTEHKVFVKGTTEEQRKLEALRQQVQPFAQNGYGPTAIGSIIGATNYEALMQKLDFYEKRLKEEQAELQNSAQQSQQAIQQIASEDKNRELEFKYYDGDEDRASRERIAALTVQGSLASTLMTGNPEKGYDEALSILTSATKDLADINMKREELRVKEKDILSKVKIAETNKNKYDVKSKK